MLLVQQTLSHISIPVDSLLEDEHSLMVTVSILDLVLVLCSLLYWFCFYKACKKLSSLHNMSSHLGLKKLLVLSVILVCVIRSMTFIGLVLMDVADVKAHYLPSNASVEIPSNHNSKDRHQSFYDASMIILFDLPNGMFVSTYILLGIVWSECFIQSRIHSENATHLKRRAVFFYTIFNSCLYGSQLVLYSIVLLLYHSRRARNILYIAMISINCCAMAFVAFLYFSITIKFAGYPSRISTQSSLEKISKVLAFWTMSRILWAFGLLVIYIYGIELLQNSISPIVLTFLFLVCEISPILVMLDYSYIQIIGFGDEGSGSDQQLDVLAEERTIQSSCDDWLGSLTHSLTRTTGDGSLF